MEKKYISIDQLWRCETCFWMDSNGKCRSDCDTVESYRPAYSKFIFADVAPVVHGEWKFIDHDETGYTVECSHCGVKFKFSSKARLTKHCPDCGTIMDGGGE